MAGSVCCGGSACRPFDAPAMQPPCYGTLRTTGKCWTPPPPPWDPLYTGAQPSFALRQFRCPKCIPLPNPVSSSVPCFQAPDRRFPVARKAPLVLCWPLTSIFLLCCWCVPSHSSHSFPLGGGGGMGCSVYDADCPANLQWPQTPEVCGGAGGGWNVLRLVLGCVPLLCFAFRRLLWPRPRSGNTEMRTEPRSNGVVVLRGAVCHRQPAFFFGGGGRGGEPFALQRYAVELCTSATPPVHTCAPTFTAPKRGQWSCLATDEPSFLLHVLMPCALAYAGF